MNIGYPNKSIIQNAPQIQILIPSRNNNTQFTNNMIFRESKNEATLHSISKSNPSWKPQNQHKK